MSSTTICEISSPVYSWNTDSTQFTKNDDVQYITNSIQEIMLQDVIGNPEVASRSQSQPQQNNNFPFDWSRYPEAVRYAEDFSGNLDFKIYIPKSKSNVNGVSAMSFQVDPQTLRKEVTSVGMMESTRSQRLQSIANRFRHLGTLNGYST